MGTHKVFKSCPCCNHLASQILLSCQKFDERIKHKILSVGNRRADVKLSLEIKGHEAGEMAPIFVSEAHQSVVVGNQEIERQGSAKLTVPAAVANKKAKPLFVKTYPDLVLSP